MQFFKNIIFQIFCMDLQSFSSKYKEKQDLIAQCQSIAKAKGLEFSLLSLTYPNQLNDMLEEHQQHLMKFGEEFAKKHLQQALITKLRNLFSDKQSITISKNKVDNKEKDIQKISSKKLVEQSKQALQEMFVEKEKQIEYQLKLIDQWKNQRKLSQSQWKAVDQKFAERLRKCIPLQFIIRQKITSLKRIHIVYHQKKDKLNQEWFRYSISAFRLFKLIHKNKQLKECSIKGVQIETFQQFLRKLKAVKIEYKGKLQNKLSNWMKNFNPSKSLRLCINSQVKFYVSSHKSAYRIDQLSLFIELFSEVSDITVKICLGKCKYIDSWMHNMRKLVGGLQKAKNIRVKVDKRKDFFENRYDIGQLASVLRCGLFGELASLTNITYLQLNDINFTLSKSVPINLLANEQIVRDIFEKNSIKHLNLNISKNFPIPPKTTLQSININSSFRKMNTLRSLVQQNPQLKSIECSLIRQSLIIDEKLFNQLQSLSIHYCDNISVSQLKLQSPSNIKYLKLGGSPIVTHFPFMLPKLCYLTFLSITNINFGDLLVCSIPSPNLEEIIIQANHEITERGIEEIDKKWSKLRYLQLWWCPRLSGVTWINCKFEGLISLVVDHKAFMNGEKNVKLLRSKGVKLAMDRFH